MNQEITGLIQKASGLIVEFLVKYSLQVLGGIIILIIGARLAQWFSSFLVKVCERRHLDVTLTKFLSGILKGLVIGFALILALDKFGITITPFIAAVSALAFGGSFAIQGPLSNYAAGLSIILTKPFVVGDTITLIGVSGVVEEVKLSNILLSTVDGEKVMIPNKHIVGEVIHNSKANKVVESVVGISYGDDPEKAIEVIRRAMQKFPNIVATPAAQVGIRDFGDSSVNIGLRYWVPTKQYFQTLYAVNLALYKALRDVKITIPFPQRDLHIISNSATSLSGAGSHL